MFVCHALHCNSEVNMKSSEGGLKLNYKIIYYITICVEILFLFFSSKFFFMNSKMHVYIPFGCLPLSSVLYWNTCDLTIPFFVMFSFICCLKRKRNNFENCLMFLNRYKTIETGTEFGSNVLIDYIFFIL